MTSQPPNLEAEAASWLVQLDAGTADEDAFAAWRNADPRHAVAFALAQASWESMGRMPATPDADEPASPLLPAPAVDRRQWLRVAAAALPVMAIGGAAFAILGESPAHAKTRVGERKRFTAMPGVMVELNTDSAIGWAKTENACEMWLERGEAAILIDGARLTGAVLHCGQSEMILAPGFYNARYTPQEAALHVMDGDAWLRGKSATRARVGEKLTVKTGAPAVEPLEATALQSASAWQRGEIIFTGQPLDQALAEYNRYLDNKMEVSDPELAQLRIGGRFETARPEAFLTAMETAFDLDAVRQDGKILLKRKVG